MKQNIFEKIARQNTGSNMLDSGSTYGYRYNSPLNKNRVQFSVSGSYFYGTTISTTEFLKDTLNYNSKLTKSLISHSNTKKCKDMSWYEVIESWAENKGLKEAIRENTCNWETDLDQGILFTVFSVKDEWYYDKDAIIIIQTHNGCDTRSGYSTPIVCSFQDEASRFLDMHVSICIESGVDKDGKELTHEECQAIDEEWQSGYSNSPSYQFENSVEAFISLSPEKIVCRLKTGETVTVYPDFY